MKKLELVFIPTPAIGHFVSSVEFAKRLLFRDDRFSASFLVMDTPISPEFTTYIQSLASSNTIPRLRFINLPPVKAAAPPSVSVSLRPEVAGVKFIESHKFCVKDSIINQVLLPEPVLSVVGFVVDTFTISMIDVATELGFPSYLFNTSGVACLGFLLHLIPLHDQVGREFRASDSESVVVPGYVNPIPSTVLPSLLFDKDGGGYICFLNLVRRFKETKAIINNSFEELESHAVKTLSELDKPIFTVGPLLDLHGQTQSSSSLCNKVQHDEVMKWLDNQPPASVVYLCFGSMQAFDEAQAREIAEGLEQSGHKFLLSIRIIKESDKSNNFEEILPQGFLERIKGVGMVCNWSPQIEILAHYSIGGFVSHCGWNSILESLWYGVPILTWPMHSEQQLNAFQMVKDLGLAMEMRLDYKFGEGDLVRANEIEKAINCLMEGDSEVRKKVKKMSEMCREAVRHNGSSFSSFGQLIELFISSSN